MFRKPIPTVTRSQLMTVVARTRVPILLEFYTRWCPVCDQVERTLQRLRSTLRSSARILRVNADREYELVREFGIKAVPTFVFLKKGQVTGVLTGNQGLEALRCELRRAGAPNPQGRQGKIRSRSA